MREIKFRAYCKNGGYMDVNLYGQNPPLQRNVFLAVTQFTGLLDKNGVELYEGDIIADSNYFKYLIIYDTNEARFGAVCKGKTYDLNKNEIYQVKIIGNIYENPELLNISEDKNEL